MVEGLEALDVAAGADAPHAARKTVVFVTEIPPAPMDDGATRRTAALMDVIRAKYDIACIFIGDEGHIERSKERYPEIAWISIPSPERIGARGLGIFGTWGEKASFLVDHYVLGDGARHAPSARIGAELKALQARYDVLAVFTRFFATACMLGPTDVPLVIDVDDDLEAYLASGTPPPRWNSPTDLLAAWRNRIMITRYRRTLPAAQLAFFSRREDVVRRGGIVRTVFAPNHFGQPPEAFPCRSHRAGRLRIGLLAGATTNANLSGARWLVGNVIAPILSDASLRDRVQFVLAGRVSAWIAVHYTELANNPAVDILGKIDLVDAFYASVDIATSPVFFGGGTSVKFHEALSWGLPVMSSIFGARGYEGPTCGPVLISDSPAAWIAAVRELATDADALATLKTKAQDMRAEMAAGHDEFATNILGALARLEQDTRAVPGRTKREPDLAPLR